MTTPLRALLVLLPTTFAGAAELMPINDLRVGVALGVLGPQVHEELNTPTTGKTSGDWSGNHGMTVRYELDYLNGLSRRGVAKAGFVWGTGLLYSATNIHPDDFGVATFRTAKAFTFREYGLALFSGYATEPHITEYGEYTWEFLPVARGGYAWAETIDPADRRNKRSGGGTFWELGGQLGWTLQDKGWLLNIFAGYTYGVAEVAPSLSQGSSTLTITRSSPEIGATIGARF